MYCRAVMLKNLKNGECFTLRDVSDRDSVPDRMVYIRQEYDRSEKKYECCKADDFCHCSYFKGTKVVFTDFTY